MTIIELVIAFAILMVVLIPVAMLLSNTIGQAASARERLTALSLAEQYIEKLNNTPVLAATATAHTALETTANHTLPKTNVTVHVGSTRRSTVMYAIYARFTWALHENSTPDLCASGTAPTLLDLKVTAEWGRTPKKISDTTLINFPATGILTEGFLAVNVAGNPVTGPPSDAGGHAWSTRVQAVPVTITPDATVTTGFAAITRYPNQYGCVFQEVPPGKYTVSVADPSTGTPAGTNFGTPPWIASYAELRGETTTTPAGVTVGQVATVTFQYDEGSMVKVTYPSTTLVEGAVSCPGAGSIECLAAGQAPSSSRTPAATPVAVLSVLSASGWSEYKTPATRVVASACAGTKRCISVGTARTGSAFVGSSVSSGTGTVNFTADPVPAGVTALNAIVCPTTSKCYAWGTGGSGAVILSGTVGAGGVAWHNDTGLAGATTVHALSCVNATSCLAAAATPSGPALLSLPGGTAWVQDSLPATPAAVVSVTQVACRTATCFALAASATKPLILSQSATSATKWIEDTIPAVTALSTLECASTSHCYAAGKKTGAAAIVSLQSITKTATTTTNKVVWTADPIQGAATSLTTLQCPGTSSCYATGTASTGPAIVSLYRSASTWTVDALPTGLAVVTGLTCPAATQCMATVLKRVAGTVLPAVLSLAGSPTWQAVSLPAGARPLYLAGVACSSAASRCIAPGATATGPALLWSTLSGTLWHLTSPNGVTGMYVNDAPVAVYNSGLAPTTTVEVASPAPTSGDVSSIGPLFPFASGYEVGASACVGGVTATSPTVTSVPGTTFTSTPAKTKVPTAALSMGVLPVQVVSATGSPVAGATVTFTPTCARLAPPPGQANQTTFTLGTTDGTGEVGLAVMYGKYKLTATSGSLSVTDVVTVSKSSITVGSVTTALPTPAVVRL